MPGKMLLPEVNHTMYHEAVTGHGENLYLFETESGNNGKDTLIQCLDNCDW